MAYKRKYFKLISKSGTIISNILLEDYSVFDSENNKTKKIFKDIKDMKNIDTFYIYQSDHHFTCFHQVDVIEISDEDLEKIAIKILLQKKEHVKLIDLNKTSIKIEKSVLCDADILERTFKNEDIILKYIQDKSNTCRHFYSHFYTYTEYTKENFEEKLNSAEIDD